MKKITQSDVIIVGAGISGCAVGYYLSKKGIKSTIIDSKGIGEEASGWALGDLNTLTGQGLEGPLYDFAKNSLSMHSQLNEEFSQNLGIDIKLQFINTTFVAMKNEDFLELEFLKNQFTNRKLNSCWMDSHELINYEPTINPQALGGIVAEGMGLLDPRELTKAFMKEVEIQGGNFIKAEVKELIWNNDKIVGVKTNNKDIQCKIIVFAMGPWAIKIQNWIKTKINLPVRPVKGQIIRLETTSSPNSYIDWRDTYLIKKSDGLTWVGTTMEEAGFDKSISDEANKDIMSRATFLSPILSDAKQVMQTACLRPVTADWLPILDVLPNHENAYIITGGGRKGILLAPGMGKYIADMIYNEKSDSLNPYGLKRFSLN
jgi:glycine oxidase